MNLNIKVLTTILGGSLAILLIWIFFLMNTNRKLSFEVKELQENFDALNGFNEILLYDLDTARDSLRLLQQRQLYPTEEIDNNINKNSGE
ncbi:MAG: hypothetical protein WC994_00600 [Brumimicrobium sp.]